jgi:hypothetical protein
VTRSVELPDAPINFPTSITRNCHFQVRLSARS